MKLRLFTTLGMTAAVVLAACGGTGGTTATSPTAAAGLAALPDVKVGLATSKTGAANFYNPQQTNGAQLAVDQFNATGGFQGGRQKIQLIVEDDGSTKDQGITVFKKFVEQDKVAAILGPTLSAVAAGAHPVAQASGTPVIAISNTGLGIVGKCDYGPCDWIFRASLGEETALPAALKAAKDKLGLKKVVLMFESDQKFAADGAEIFKKAAADNGITIARTIPYKTADVDFSAFVTQAKGESPDAILASGLAGTSSKVLIEVGKQFPQGLRVVGSNGFNSPAVITAAGAAAPNMIVGTAWNKASTDKTNVDFVKAFKDKYGSDPDQFATQAYTAMIVLADAMKRSGNASDKAALKKALEGTKDLATPLGAFSFTPEHDVKQPVFVMTVKDGQFVPFN